MKVIKAQKYKWINVVAIFFCLFFIGSCFADSSDQKEIERFSKNLHDNDRKNRQKIPQPILSNYNKKYSQYKIYEYCEGSFTGKEAKEYVLSIVNPVTYKGWYLSITNPQKNKYELHEIAKIEAVMNHKYFMGVSGVYCLSSEKIKDYWIKFHNTKESKNIHWARKPMLDLGYYCIDLSFSSNYDESCYGYDKAQKKITFIYGVNFLPDD